MITSRKENGKQSVKYGSETERESGLTSNFLSGKQIFSYHFVS